MFRAMSGCALALVLASCANMGSISRTTSIPGKDEDSTGKAIHLDVKQRLVITKAFGIVCAEPSPDALATYAASLGAGVSVPSQGAVSVAQALNESGASIGLRTQSITLMRDTLYRTCEAYYNKALTGPQVTQLLARAQDLTLAVLAIEQLTGAVAAKQAVLGGAASASSSANLLTMQSALNAAQQNEAAKERELQRAKDEQTRIDGELSAANTKLTAAKAAGDQALITQLTQTVNTLQQQSDAQKGKVTEAQTQREKARQAREAIESNYDSAITSASASAAGSGTFSDADNAVQLNEQSVQHISAAVDNIVVNILNKSHTEDFCLALLTDNPPNGSLQYWNEARKWCIDNVLTGSRASSSDPRRLTQ